MAQPSIAAIQRLKKEYQAILKDKPPFIQTRPHNDNLLIWHYAIEGPPGSVYEGGVYHGKIVFPAEYPYKGPAIMMITPSGRFETNKPLCLTMSNYHPESWNPLWSVSSILQGLLSFMLENTPTAGSVSSSDTERRELAAASHFFNGKNADFRRYFSHLIRGLDVRQLRSNNQANEVSSGPEQLRRQQRTKQKPAMEKQTEGQRGSPVQAAEPDELQAIKTNVVVDHKRAMVKRGTTVGFVWKGLGLVLVLIVFVTSFWISRR